MGIDSNIRNMNLIIKNQNMVTEKNHLMSQNRFYIYFRVFRLYAYPFVVVEIDNGKMKTRKSALKRFKVAGTGKLIRRQCGKQHLNEKKSRSRKNRLSLHKKVAESDIANVAKCLPYKFK